MRTDTAKTETGGTFWNAVFRRVVVGMMFGHILYGCVLLVKEAYGQMVVVIMILLCDLLFINYCYHAYELPSNVVPLGVAATKDRRTGEEGVCKFSNQTYEQPPLRFASVEPQVVTVEDEEAIISGDDDLGGSTSYGSLGGGD